MIKILFLINTLGGGGAERVLVNLVNNMDKEKFDITVETMFADGVNRRMLSPEIHYLNKNPLNIRGLSNIIKYIPAKLLYKYYIDEVDYDLVVAYMHGIPTKVLSPCAGMPKIAWLHYGNPEKGTFFDFWFDRKKAISAYDSFDAIVGVSQSVTDAFREYTGIQNKCYTLYNTNDTSRILRLSRESSSGVLEGLEGTIFCSSGRLTDQKGFDRLIESGKRLFNDGYKFTIIIMGAGLDEEKLKMLVRKNAAESYIKLIGFCENPYSIMQQCDVYISSSREEGLATVLTEALTLGMPVISTDVSGAKEVLGSNNEYGLVVENSEDGIYRGMKRFLENEDMIEQYKSVAKKRAERFNTENTVRETEQFFERIVKL